MDTNSVQMLMQERRKLDKEEKKEDCLQEVAEEAVEEEVEVD